MPQYGDDWVAAAVTAAKEASPIASSISDDLLQRLRATMSDRELTKAEQIQIAKCLIRVARNSARSEGVRGED